MIYQIKQESIWVTDAAVKLIAPANPQRANIVIQNAGGASLFIQASGVDPVGDTTAYEIKTGVVFNMLRDWGCITEKKIEGRVVAAGGNFKIHVITFFG